MSADVADRGLLITLLQLLRSTEAPTTSTAVAEALGIPAEYADVIERRLRDNRERGLVERDAEGRWSPTPAGLAAAASARGPSPSPPGDGVFPGVPL